MKRVAALAIALALSVSAVTVHAEPPLTATPAPSSEPGTPLALRPSKPLDVMREPAPASIGWKIAAVAVLAAGAAVFLRKRFRPTAPSSADLRIIRRASIGMRSELVIVDVEGQRLLLGVTGSSIQHLASLDAAAAEQAVEEPAAVPLARRFEAMLDAADRPSPSNARASADSSAARIAADDLDVPGQARGLLRLRSR